MSKSASKTSSEPTKKKSVNKVVILGGFGFFILIYIFLRFYTPPSTLQWEEESEESISLREVCGDQRELYPRSLHTWALPAHSPNGKYYIDVSEAKLGRSVALNLYQENTKQKVGSYYSSYPSLKVYCWAEDSSGIYVADYKPVYGYGGIFTPSPKTGPVKKLLVP